VPHDEAVIGGDGSQRMLSVVAGGPGLVAVGYDFSGDGRVAAVWTSPDGFTWAQVPHDEAVFGGDYVQFMTSVVAGGPGLVAVGADCPGGDCCAAVWTSPDGLSWARVPHDEAIFGGRNEQVANDQVMVSVVAGGPGLVAVGYDVSGGDGDAAVWTSADGFTWTRVPHDEAIFGGDYRQEMGSVVAGGPGLVAVGYDVSGGDGDAAVWTSADGFTWARVPHDEAIFGGDDDQEMTSVVAGGPGLVAVGYDAPGWDGDAAVWTSADGLSWARVPHDEAIFGGHDDQEMNSVVAGGPGLVAVGYDGPLGDRDAAVWTSPDGLTWVRVPHDVAIFGGHDDQEMNSVVAVGSGLVAVGKDGHFRNDDAAVWTSPDGLTWTRVPSEVEGFGGSGGQVMKAVAAGGPGLVAVGFDESGGDSDAAVWTSPDGLAWTRVPHDDAIFGGSGDQLMSAVAAGGPGLIAVGYDRSAGYRDAAVWTSPDGLTWTRVPHNDAVFGGSGDQVMNAVALGGPGLVAVGYDRLSADADAAVWTSPDGLAWTRVPHDEAVFGGANSQEMRAVTAGGPGLVAVGFDGTGGGSAAVWTSPDGLAWTRVPHDEAIFGGTYDQMMLSVVAGGPGLVAVGSQGTGVDSDAAVWTSPDGLTWTRVPHDKETFDGLYFQEMLSVAAGGPGLVAVGFAGPFTRFDAAVWTSPDGFTWNRVPHDETTFGGAGSQKMLSVAVAGSGLVAVGYEGSSRDEDAAVWYWTPDG
jgi:hypothetical protein